MRRHAREADEHVIVPLGSKSVSARAVRVFVRLSARAVRVATKEATGRVAQHEQEQSDA